MELKEFIKASLLEIRGGVHEANAGLDKPLFRLSPGGDSKSGTGIHFDVAVTTKAETATGGKAGVHISVVELSTGGKSQEAKESVSRISFTIQIDYHFY